MSVHMAVDIILKQAGSQEVMLGMNAIYLGVRKEFVECGLMIHTKQGKGNIKELALLLQV